MKKILIFLTATLLLSAEEAPVEELEIEEAPIEFLVSSSAAEELNQEEEKEDIIPIIEEEDLEAIEDEAEAEEEKLSGIVIDIGQVYAGSPTIYSILLLLSMASMGIWFYTLLSLRSTTLLPNTSLKELREKLISRDYDAAKELCTKNKSVLFQMLSCGLSARSHGQTIMLDMMKSEGQRATTSLWQKIALLNDIAIIAPMLGLLGTVLGMFYAFYDLNRSMESISVLFDGLGISVGTTVCGLVVAILAMMFHSLAKYRLVRQLSLVENEAQTLANLIKESP